MNRLHLRAKRRHYLRQGFKRIQRVIAANANGADPVAFIKEVVKPKRPGQRFTKGFAPHLVSYVRDHFLDILLLYPRPKS